MQVLHQGVKLYRTTIWQHPNRTGQKGFWTAVVEAIEDAGENKTVKVSAKYYDWMPVKVVEALEERGVTLAIDVTPANAGVESRNTVMILLLALAAAAVTGYAVCRSRKAD